MLLTFSCGKLLKSELDAQVTIDYENLIGTGTQQAHAVRTNHQNFVESTEEMKPLTPEEKAAQIARYQESVSR